MFKIVRQSEGKLRKIAQNKTSINYITKEFSPNLSLAITEGKDYYEKEISQNDRIYYCLSGQLEVNPTGKGGILQPGDSVFISKGSEYEISGTFKAIVANSPAFEIPVS